MRVNGVVCRANQRDRRDRPARTNARGRRGGRYRAAGPFGAQADIASACLCGLTAGRLRAAQVVPVDEQLVAGRATVASSSPT